jgi:hypothetical protein
MTIRLPAVEDVLNAPIDQLTAADLQRAVDDHVREQPDLDFKMELYGNLEELAKDVVAMANAAGGLLVLGIRDNNGSAQEVTPVDLSDDEERRMHQGLRARTVPFIPDVVIRPIILETDDTGHHKGFYLIAIGRSLIAPHGVMAQGDEKKRTYWPVRSGTTTRYLSEPELAEFYRCRFRGAEERDRELAKVWEDGISGLSSQLVWLAVAAVPSLPGQLPVGGALLHHVQRMAWDWADGFWPKSSFGLFLRNIPRLGRFAPGVRRTTWDADGDGGFSKTAYAEFHQSGATFSAVVLSDSNDYDSVLDQQQLEAELLGLLFLLGCHAREARASGELTILAGLRAPNSHVLELGRPKIMSPHIDRLSDSQYHLGSFTAEAFSIGLDELLTYEGAAEVTYQFAVDFAGLFGVIDAGLVTGSGSLRQDSGGLREFFPWAEAAGLKREQGT